MLPTQTLLFSSSSFFHLGFVRFCIILVIVFRPTHTHATCNPVDKESLLPLATMFPQLNWSVVADCCSWDGISCDDKGSRVIELSIPNRGLGGAISSSLQNLTSLSTLDMSYNFLSGSLPDGLFSSFNNLKIIDLSFNRLSGHLPDNFPATLQSLNLSSNHFNGTIQTAFLMLSPTAEIGNLQAIHILDLSQNNFSGSIPNAISNLTNLEKLELSNNLLSGEIPASLKSLYFLSSFNVAHNNLQGPIPTGGQFDTFSNQIYEGNPGLCGPPLQKTCSNQSSTTYSSLGHKKGPHQKKIIGLILGICVGVGILSCLAWWKFSKRRNLPRGDTEMVSINSTSVVEVPKDAGRVIMFPNSVKDIKELAIDDIRKATEEFSQSNIIGCGSFGLVYKATFENGTKVAVKMLSIVLGVVGKEFEAEVKALSTAQHKNLVSLLGYYVDNGCQILLYSYMENGSLDYWLHEKTDEAAGLNWPIRLKIAQGASCGLAYLHHVCEPHIVHRDIRSSNILLDEEFEAHIADFGFSRLIQSNDTHVTTELVGTLGYIPPEYGQSLVATMRGDVYSFGVLLLELLTGRRPVEVFRSKECRDLVVWVQQLRKEGKQDEVFDPLLRGKGSEMEMLKVLDVACMCVYENPIQRPNIKEVVDWLQDVRSNHARPNLGQM